MKISSITEYINDVLKNGKLSHTSGTQLKEKGLEIDELIKHASNGELTLEMAANLAIQISKQLVEEFAKVDRRLTKKIQSMHNGFESFEGFGLCRETVFGFIEPLEKEFPDGSRISTDFRYCKNLCKKSGLSFQSLVEFCEGYSVNNDREALQLFIQLQHDTCDCICDQY